MEGCLHSSQFKIIFNMSIQKEVEQNFISAFKAKEEIAISTLRMLKSSLINKMIEKRMAKDEVLPDEEAVSVIKSEIKKRQDSIEAYQQGGRADLVAKEQAEVEVLKKYLPQQLAEEEVKKIVQETIAEMGVSSPSDFGKVMGNVMSKVKGQSDGNVISRLVKEELK